jgi:hypothetical protein
MPTHTVYKTTTYHKDPKQPYCFYFLILPLLLCNQFWKSPIKIQEKVSSCLV